MIEYNSSKTNEIAGNIDRTFCVAPMLDLTDRHCRYFFRLMSRHALLYTEMVTASALLNGRAETLLAYHPQEHPVAFQIGGSDPQELADCAELITDYGYDEINLNVGCPSDRVQNGRFGACLMATPELVADCVQAMQERVSIPVTVKSRIGIDHQDSYQQLADFIDVVAGGGCRTFILHARKAWLNGLSPKQNREIPPLNYDYVYRIKRQFPQLEIILNGGITDLQQAEQHLSAVDGVMLGRQVYHQPYMLTEVDGRFFGSRVPGKSRREVVAELVPYLQAHLQRGGKTHHLCRHVLGLFHGEKGARGWRRFLSQQAVKIDADENTLWEALKFTGQ